MKKAEKIRKLLEDNRVTLLNGEKNNGICFDGIVDEEIYDRQKLKVAVLLKETNGNDFSGNEVENPGNFEYADWLKHQQVNNEPELRKRGDAEYWETNVFYHPTFRKLCHWLSMFFDIVEHGETTPEKFMTEGKVDVDKVRTVLNKIALINLKKSWGKEKTDATALCQYAVHEKISPILKKQLEIIGADFVLCCSPDVFWIAKELYGVNETEVIHEEDKCMFIKGGKKFIKFYHPQWYGKKEMILANEAREVFDWAIQYKR